MAFPTVKVRFTSTNTNTTSHTIDLSSLSLSSGDLVVLIFAANNNSGITAPTGWTKQRTGAYNGTEDCAVITRECDGTEGSSVTVTTSESDPSAYGIIVFTSGTWGAYYFSTGAAYTGGSGNGGDPDSLTPPDGADDIVWIAWTCSRGNDMDTGGQPTNYTAARAQTVKTGNSSSNASMASADRENNASSEDPGEFTWGNPDYNEWAGTIAVYPASSADQLDGSLFSVGPTFPTGKTQQQIQDSTVFAVGPTYPTGLTQQQIAASATFQVGPTFGVGATEQNAQGVLFSVGPTFFSGQTNQTIDGAVFTVGPTFGTGTLAEPVSAPATFTVGPSFPTGLTEQTIIGATFASGISFPTGEAQGSAQLDGVLFTVGPTFGAGITQQTLIGQTFTPAGLPNIVQQQGNGGTGTGLTLTFDDPPVEGNFLVAAIMTRSSTQPSTATLPSGWSTAVEDNNTTSADWLGIYYKVAGASEPQAHAWSGWADDTHVGIIFELDGMAMASLLDEIADGANQSTSTTKTSGTTATTDDQPELILAAFGSRDNRSSVGYSNGFTEIGARLQAAPNPVVIWLAWLPVSGAGTYESTITINTSGTLLGVIGSFRTAGGGLFNTGLIEATVDGVVFQVGLTFPTGQMVGAGQLDGVLFQVGPTFPAGITQQTVEGSLFQVGPSFPTATIEQTIEAAATFQVGPSFSTGSTTQTINGTTFQVGPSFVGGALTEPGQITAPVTFQVGATFPAGLTQQTIDGATFASGISFPAGLTEQTIDGALFQVGPTFFVGDLEGANTLTGVLFQSGISFPQGSTTQTINGSLFTVAATFPTGTVGAAIVYAYFEPQFFRARGTPGRARAVFD